MRKFDVIVLGAGSAGYAAARTATDAGAKVAVIEGGKKIGGLCILRGCMPTKALLESSHRWHDIGKAGTFGLNVKPLAPDFSKIMARKNRLINGFAGYRQQQLKKGPATFLRGTARFLDARHVELRDGKTREKIFGQTFIIATGSEIQSVALPGLNETGFITSDSALKLKKLPKSLIVLGGGAIAVEFAQIFHDLGVPTTILQRSAHLVKEFDPEVSDELAKAFRAEGLQIFTETKLLSVEKRGREKAVIFHHAGKKKTVVAAEILYALGRRPALSRLNLAAAEVALAEDAVAVDAELRTNQNHIFAAGDVTGLYEVVHIAIQQAEIAGWNAAQMVAPTKLSPRQIDYRLKASVVFTQPEIASVGLTAREARAQNIEFVTASYPFNDHGKSVIMGAKFGFVKLLAEKKRGEIIGAQIIGPHASDLIHELIAVMHYHGTAAELATMPHYHPTLAEIVTYPAEEIAAILAA